MTQNTRTLLGAAAVFVAFVGLAYFMPVIMLAAGEISPWLAGALLAAFIFGLFVVFWLRGRLRR